MASTQRDPNTITIQEALPQHVSSLSTIHVRSFHPTNAFHRKVFPDTPLVQNWWSNIFSSEIQDPTAHVLIALDTQATDPALQVIGVICMRLMDPSVPGAGMWSMYPLTTDHDAEEFQPSVEFMAEWREKLFGREQQWHYLLEYAGVDHARKGTGVGRRLLERACEIADAKGYPVFVEGNHFAVGWYQKCGFEERGRKVMPGKEAYKQHVLVRPVKGTR
ncbi:hypothetical protein M409DRAFT_64118 [Zasmidium cellare ATCC 36951]|uniref:N-acetyltransferase domain-containing protein n=1 Tax=Zasmidium cellare ATCC 36951 TaxID=1080233 RepID=A0A6A6CT67_ZASCE|nr:uncharacterized protein M409DRAFT_64118 [Zasmidium cellare ATCC 36951]KAF2170344.1 hypothetical protein M409DRAFT_64118 [Zasmidium cellare ATCC 36951]